MAASKGASHKELPVSGVYRYFKALEKTKALKAFLEDCDKREHTVGVSKALFNLGHKHFKKSKATQPARTTRAVPQAVPGGGGQCPACPKPPKL